MKTENIIRLERLTGQIEGLASCVENKRISGGLFDIVEVIDCIIKNESEGNTE